MRLAMILGALGLVFLLPVSDAAANQRPQDRATAQQPRGAAPQAQPAAAAARPAAQAPRTPAAQRAAPQQRQAARPAAQAPRAAAAQRATPQQRQASRPAAQAQHGTAAPRTTAPQRPAQAATQRTGLFRSAAAAPAGMPRATGSCARRDAQGRCVRTTASNTRWQGGLPPMTMAQQECPSGTVATLARGHANVVRCLPI